MDQLRDIRERREKGFGVRITPRPRGVRQPRDDRSVMPKPLILDDGE